jgi:hypothetical protein
VVFLETRREPVDLFFRVLDLDFLRPVHARHGDGVRVERDEPHPSVGRIEAVVEPIAADRKPGRRAPVGEPILRPRFLMIAGDREVGNAGGERLPDAHEPLPVRWITAVVHEIPGVDRRRDHLIVGLQRVHLGHDRMQHLVLASPLRTSRDHGRDIADEGEIRDHSFHESDGDGDEPVHDLDRIGRESLLDDRDLLVEARTPEPGAVVAEQDQIEGIGRVPAAKAAQEAPRGVAGARHEADQGVRAEHRVVRSRGGPAHGSARLVSAGRIGGGDRLGQRLQPAYVRAAGEKRQESETGDRVE